MKISIEVVFSVRQEVFLKTDPDQLMRLVHAFQITESGSVLYGLVQEKNTSWHYGWEISDSKTI